VIGLKVFFPTIILTFVLFIGGMEFESADLSYGQSSDEKSPDKSSLLKDRLEILKEKMEKAISEEDEQESIPLEKKQKVRDNVGRFWD
jgi:hypothetical protein